MLILVAVFVLSFFTSVVLALSFPHIRVNDTERDRLAAENQALKIETANAAFWTGRLSRRVSKIEQTSIRIQDLIHAD